MSALIIANTIFERFITRFSHLVAEVVERTTKKFYQSMKSKFLRERMSASTRNIYKILINLKLNALAVFDHCKSSIFMNEVNLKRIELKDFEPYENIITVFNSNLKILFDNNLININELKLDKSIADKYINEINSMQSYDYKMTYNRLKVIQDYFKALTNKTQTDINSRFSEEKWFPAEIDYSISELLGYIFKAKYLKSKTDFILNDTVGAQPENRAEDEAELAILIYKNEININSIKFVLSNCFCAVLQAVHDFLALGATFLAEEPDIIVTMVQRTIDSIIVPRVLPLVEQLPHHSVHLVGGRHRVQAARQSNLRPLV